MLQNALFCTPRRTDATILLPRQIGGSVRIALGEG
jgi:hypothetical protein